MSATVESNELLANSLLEALGHNKRETESCREYKNDLQMATRNLQSFQNRLSVDVMVPIGPHALMPGHLYHTNEVLIGKPSGIFIEATTNQALDIVQRRMKVADQRLKDLAVEEEFFRNKLEYPQKKDVFSQEDQKEIIEEYDEEAEKQWRIGHKQKIREAKQKEREEREKKRVPDEEFHAVLENLEELELMEELQDEFNSIVVDPEPIDLTGVVEFKEKPRVSYELESFCSKAEADHNGAPTIGEQALGNGTITEGEAKPKRKSLQFSEDLEKIKLIRKMDRPSTLITAYDPELTLQLKFRHSPMEYQPPPKSDCEEITSPVDIYNRFAHCLKHFTAPSTPDDQPRSILKKTTHTIPVNRNAKLVSAEEEEGSRRGGEPPEFVASSAVNIYEQVVGDVLERNAVRPSVVAGEEEQKKQNKKAVNFSGSSAVVENVAEEPKRVSRFKAMRS